MKSKIPISVQTKSKLRPFSKLKNQIENLFAPELKMKFCCSAYPMRSKTGYASNFIPRFYLKMDKEIIWDFPKDFAVKDIGYGMWANNNGISDLVREYIDTPLKELLYKDFESEKKEYWAYTKQGEVELSFPYNLTDLFKAADRRIGKATLVHWSGHVKNFKAYKIICVRLYGWEGLTKQL